MFTTATTTRPVHATASAKVTGKGLIAAIHGGTVKFAKVRASGTERHWPVYAPGSKERTLGESILEARAKKVTVEAIAKNLSVSVPTVRRHITAMAFTMEVEGMKVKEREALAKVLNATAPKEQAPAKAPATAKPKASKPAAPTSGSATAKALAKKAAEAAKPAAPVQAAKSHTN